MRTFIFVSSFMVLTSVLRADHQAQMTWRGQIDGPTTLRIHGDRVDVDRDGLAAAPSYQFATPLPASRQEVQVLVRQGRVDARVIEQPRANNDFRAVVEVTPRGRAGQNAALEFYWNPAGRRGDVYSQTPGGRVQRNRNMGPGSMTWSGRVDQEAVVEIRNRRAVTTTLRGQRVSGDQTQFSGAMPRQEVPLRLENAQGRGNVELIEQPGPQNNYTARVRIRDDQAGADNYSFVLSWDDAYAYSDSQPPIFSRLPGSQNLGYGQMQWSGRVDGRIRVTVQGDRASVTRISGGPVVGQRADFSGRFDARSANQVSVRKLEGRDEVDVVEMPSPSNGYRLVFEIDDDDAGADDYVVEVTW
jgi:hypothetical protein